jgi:hypothetical protein
MRKKENNDHYNNNLVQYNNYDTGSRFCDDPGGQMLWRGRPATGESHHFDGIPGGFDGQQQYYGNRNRGWYRRISERTYLFFINREGWVAVRRV